MSAIGPLRQAAFFGPTVANGALRTWLDLQLATPLAIDPHRKWSVHRSMRLSRGEQGNSRPSEARRFRTLGDAMVSPLVDEGFFRQHRAGYARIDAGNRGIVIAAHPRS